MVPLLALVLVAAPAPLKPVETRDLDLEIVEPDRLIIHSRYPLTHASIADLYERCSFFVEYSPNHRQACILIRTEKPELEIVMETVLPFPGLKKRRVMKIKNPTVD